MHTLKTKGLCGITLVLFIWIISSSLLQADNLVVDVSYQFESGDFSAASDTDINTVALELAYFTDSWSYQIEMPYVSISGVETILPGSNGNFFSQGQGGPGNAVTSSNPVTRSGLGDIRLSVAHAFFPKQKNGLFYEMTATAKLATADEDEFLGTGENDYSIKLDLSTNRGNWSPGVTAGYLIKGDTADTDFNDVWFFSVGTGYRVNRSLSIGIGYDFQQAVIETSDDFAALSVDLSTKLDNYQKLSFAVKSGLTDNSPDFGFSVSTSMAF